MTTATAPDLHTTIFGNWSRSEYPRVLERRQS